MQLQIEIYNNILHNNSFSEFPRDIELFGCNNIIDTIQYDIIVSIYDTPSHHTSPL